MPHSPGLTLSAAPLAFFIYHLLALRPFSDHLAFSPWFHLSIQFPNIVWEIPVLALSLLLCLRLSFSEPRPESLLHSSLEHQHPMYRHRWTVLHFWFPPLLFFHLTEVPSLSIPSLIYLFISWILAYFLYFPRLNTFVELFYKQNPEFPCTLILPPHLSCKMPIQD